VSDGVTGAAATSASSCVLVTGVNGQLGHALRASVDAWKPLDAKVVFVGRDEMDLGNASSMRRVLDELSPTLIINAAAYTAVDRAEKDVEAATAVNATAPGIMAEYLAAKRGALIHVSTDYVFDGSATEPYREDATTNPLSVYGSTKLAGENAIRASGVAHWILRTSWVFSASGANFLKTMLRFAESKDAISIVADQRGAPTDAKRLSTFIDQMLHASKDAPTLAAMVARVTATQGTYHATAAGATTWFDYARHVIAGARARKPDGPWTLAPEGVTQTTSAAYVTPARRPLYSLLDHERFTKTFGVVPPPWQQDVDACLDELLGVAR
jgi:dTDP-4-dehydrorhamnose reductase